MRPMDRHYDRTILVAALGGGFETVGKPMATNVIPAPAAEYPVLSDRQSGWWSAPEVPFRATARMAIAVVLARRSAPERVRSAAPAALAAERGSVCPGVGAGGLRARDRCGSANGTYTDVWITCRSLTAAWARRGSEAEGGRQ